MCNGVRLEAATSSTLLHSSESKQCTAGVRCNTQPPLRLNRSLSSHDVGSVGTMTEGAGMNTGTTGYNLCTFYSISFLASKVVASSCLSVVVNLTKRGQPQGTDGALWLGLAPNEGRDPTVGRHLLTA